MPVSVAGQSLSGRGKSRLIQEGSYGCAFTPALPCKHSRSQSPGKRMVGKVIKKKNAKIELSISTLIRAIPGWERYFLIQEQDLCGPKNFEELRDEYEDQCKTLRKAKDEQLVQLISPHGGTSLYDLTLTNSFDYLGNLRHVLEGVAKLQSQGICHYDLHEANVLVDTRGTFRFIDFGASFVGSEVSEDTIWRHIYNFEPAYPPQPPELSVQNGLHQGLTSVYSIQQTIAQKKVFRQMQRILGIPVAQNFQEMTAFWLNEWKDENWVSFFHTYWRSWDTWAIGVMFLRLLEKCFLLPAFVNGQWAAHSRPIKTVLKGLLQVNPSKRISADEALRLLP